MSKYNANAFNTTDLVLSVMHRCAAHLGLDIHNDDVSTRMYSVCCSLESFPKGEGVGTSDVYTFYRSAAHEFDIEIN